MWSPPPPDLRPGLVWPVPVDPTGERGPSRDAVRGPGWVRTSRGRYVSSDTDRSRVEQRIVEAAAVLPRYGGVTGWAALRWSGATWFDGLAANGRDRLDVDLATGGLGIWPQPGIRPSKEALNPGLLTAVDGLRVTNVLRSLLFEMRHAAGVREAVVHFDMAAAADLVSVIEAAGFAAGLNAWTGIPQARKALALVSENSWSPWETRLRLIWMLDAGLPMPCCNVPIFDLGGQHIGTPDLFDPVLGVVGEYDGGLHLAGAQRRSDVAREQRFRDHDLEYFSVVGSDMSDRRRVVARIQSAFLRAERRTPRARTWTLQLPPGYRSLSTVAARRAPAVRRLAQ